MPTHVLRPSALLLLVALTLAACGSSSSAGSASPDASSSIADSAEPSESMAESAEPSHEVEPSGTPAAPCLRADALAALEDIANVEVDPNMPQDAVADAVEEMDLSGWDDLVQAMQDDLVALLRDGQANTFGAQVAAGVILEETGVVAC